MKRWAVNWRRIKTIIIFLLVAGTCQSQCVSDTASMTCGNATILFARQQYDTTAPFAFVHVHENETTALQAAQWLFDSIRQSSLTTWQVQGQRFISFSLGSQNYRFDPNRIYSRAGIVATLGSGATDTAITVVQAIADSFLKKCISGKEWVIALHNNTEGGGLSINSYRRGGIYKQDALETYMNPGQDADDFFYTTEKTLFDFLKQNNCNVVLQNNQQITDDGSLSVYCARQHIPYINVETEMGRLIRQQKMLQLLWKYLATTQTGNFGGRD